MELLQQFYENKAVSTEVRNFLYATLNELALEKLFKGEDAKIIAAAKEVVDQAFSTLEERYGSIIKANLNNQAR